MNNEHTLIDEEGNSWNIKLKIENNKLYAIWDGVDYFGGNVGNGWLCSYNIKEII
ncbi:hypothetical protein LCGC14_1315740 [marine sediment metagenome]|uniref:Uncharacterized protein n=1 Tax=marine sediment metagenome TaxID=412755 RepID=A0A0F9NNG3_9ZZZZ